MSGNGKKGFTLIEMMVVLVVVAMLISFVATAIFFVMRVVKKKSRTTQAAAIKSAIQLYHTKYGSMWPLPYNSDGEPVKSIENNNRFMADNWTIISRLNPDSEYNPRGYQLLPPGTMTVFQPSSDERMSLEQAWQKGIKDGVLVAPAPLLSVEQSVEDPEDDDVSLLSDEWGNLNSTTYYFRITFNYGSRTVSVK